MKLTRLFENKIDAEMTKTALFENGPLAKDKDGWDPVSFVMAHENGELDQDETIAGFQKLVDSGMINHLQGHYQRTAHELVKAGHIHLKEGDSTSSNIEEDYQTCLKALTDASDLSAFVEAVRMWQNFSATYEPVPPDFQLAFKKVLTGKAQELNAVVELAKGGDTEWQVLAPYLGSILSASGTSSVAA